jgi:hypothetical protein
MTSRRTVGLHKIGNGKQKCVLPAAGIWNIPGLFALNAPGDNAVLPGKTCVEKQAISN